MAYCAACEVRPRRHITAARRALAAWPEARVCGPHCSLHTGGLLGEWGDGPLFEMAIGFWLVRSETISTILQCTNCKVLRDSHSGRARRRRVPTRDGRG